MLKNPENLPGSFINKAQNVVILLIYSWVPDEKRWKHSKWNADVTFSMHLYWSHSQHITSAPISIVAYHLLWSLFEVFCQYSATYSSAHPWEFQPGSNTNSTNTQRRIYIVKSAWHPVVHWVRRHWRRRHRLRWPRAHWTDRLRNVRNWISPGQDNLWRQTAMRGHGGATQRPELATRWRRRPWANTSPNCTTLHVYRYTNVRALYKYKYKI